MRKTLSKVLVIALILIIINSIIGNNFLYAYSYIDMPESKQELEFTDAEEKIEINKYINISKTGKYVYTTLNGLKNMIINENILNNQKIVLNVLEILLQAKIGIHNQLLNRTETDKNGENFIVTNNTQNGIEIYEDFKNKQVDNSLESDDIDFWVNITESWLPKDINNESDGSHNGEYYIAYTFYAENMGENTVNYLATIEIEDVSQNIDEAIRVAVFKNDNKVIYAKKNRETGLPESNTVQFYDDDTVMQEMTEKFEPGDIDKYTVVIWVEGDDPDCIDDLIGGTVKIQMKLTEEKILQ